MLKCVTANQPTVPHTGRSRFAARQRYCIFVHSEGVGQLRLEEIYRHRVFMSVCDMSVILAASFRFNLKLDTIFSSRCPDPEQ